MRLFTREFPATKPVQHANEESALRMTDGEQLRDCSRVLFDICGLLVTDPIHDLVQIQFAWMNTYCNRRDI